MITSDIPADSYRAKKKNKNKAKKKITTKKLRIKRKKKSFREVLRNIWKERKQRRKKKFQTMEKNMELNKISKDFIRAVRQGKAAAVEELVANNPELINAKLFVDGHTKVTALFDAVINHNKDVLRVLLNHGASCDAKTSNMDTPLHVAASKRYYEMLQELVNTVISSQQCSIDVRNNYKHTPLHLACEKRSKSCVDILLKAGAGVNLQDCFGRTPLHIAATGDRASVVQLLLKHGADPMIESRMHPFLRIKAGRTPVYHAMGFHTIPHSDTTILALLLDALTKDQFNDNITNYLDYVMNLGSHEDRKEEGKILLNIVINSAKKQIAYDIFAT